MLRCRACEPRNEVGERHRRCRFIAMHLRPEKHSHWARSEGDCANRPALNRPADFSNAQSRSPEERLESPPKLRVRESPRGNRRRPVLFGYCSALHRAALRPSKSVRRSARRRSTASNYHCSQDQLKRIGGGSHDFLDLIGRDRQGRTDYRFFAVAALCATAAFTSALNAPASTFSPS